MLMSDHSLRNADPGATAAHVADPNLVRTVDIATVTPAPASCQSANLDELPEVPGYRVVGEIAHGGMGRVLAAHDLTLDREVAIKVLLPGSSAADRFLRESKITARLPHPGIPPVCALGALPDGSPFRAMKLIAGQTLARELPSGERGRLLQVFEKKKGTSREEKGEEKGDIVDYRYP
jgi:serine/threonine protein kinase